MNPKLNEWLAFATDAGYHATILAVVRNNADLFQTEDGDLRYGVGRILELWNQTLNQNQTEYEHRTNE